jgi:hypothetical protein
MAAMAMVRELFTKNEVQSFPKKGNFGPFFKRLLLPQKLPQRLHIELKIFRIMSFFCLYQSQVAAQTQI